MCLPMVTLLPVYLAQDPTKRGDIIETLSRPTQDTLVGQGYNKAICTTKLQCKAR